MGIADLFRPKYRHSDPAVRADAIRQMSADEADTLASIARDDDDPAIRRIAIDKLEDPSLLVDIGQGERERSVRELALGRAAALWSSAAIAAETLAGARDALAGLVAMEDERALVEVATRAASDEVRGNALERIREPRSLAQLARRAESPALRQQALARISDAEALRAVAIDSTSKDVGLAALERIDDDDSLQLIAVKAKSKAVRNRAKKQLAARHKPAEVAPRVTAAPEISAEKMRHAERVQLVRVAEKLAKGNEWVESLAAMEQTEAEWEALGPGDDRAIAERFEAARSKYRRRRDKYASAQAKREAEERKRAAARADAGEAASEAASEPASEAAPAAVEPAAVEPAAVEPAEAEAAGPASRAVGDEPADVAVPDAEDDEKSGVENAEKAARRADNLAALDALCGELEAAAGTDSLKHADRLLKRADKSWTQHSAVPAGDRQRITDRFNAARRALFIRAKELREAEDWKRWANVPRAEQMIRNAAALLEAEAKDLAGKLKQLQGEWKSIGPLPRNKSQELWERFKAGCDQVYERVKAQRAVMAEEHAENLRAKERLCEQVEALSESTDWAETAERIKALQREWKATGPVGRKHADKVWKRFRAACDAFFERRKPHLEKSLAEQQQNLVAKEKLCEQAEALGESTDWAEAGRALKQLQRDWKDIGHVPRRDAQAINKRFRAACDQFFARRDDARRAEIEAKRAELHGLDSEIDAILIGLGEAPAPRPTEAAPTEAAPEPPDAPEAADAPEVSAEAEASDEAMSTAALDAAAIDEGWDVAPAGEAAAAAETLEPEASGAEPAPAAPTDADAGAAPPPTAPTEPAPAAPVPPTTGEEIATRTVAVRARVRELALTRAELGSFERRLSKLYRAAVAAHPEAFRGTELDPDASRRKKLKLCARIEELAPADAPARPAPGASPEEIAQSLRNALAERALGVANRSPDGRPMSDVVAELRDAWAHVGPVPGDEGAALEERFQAACERALAAAE